MAARAKKAEADACGAPSGGCASIEVKRLRGALRAVSAVVEKRNTIPVLAGALLASGPSTLTLTGTDLDMEIAVQLDLAESGAGRAMRLVADAATLEKITAKLPADATIELREDGNTGLELRCGRSRFRLPVMDAGEFPTFSGGEWDAQFEMGRGEMQALIDAVRFAISTEETRYYLNGIFLQAVTEGPELGADGAGVLVAAATDGHRLAEYRCALPDGAETLPDIILGRKAVGVIDRLLDAEEGASVALAVSSNRLRIELGGVSLVTKLIDGTFPDHRRVIPRAHPHALWFSPEAMAQAVERVLTVSAEKGRPVVLDLSGADAIGIEARSPEHGEAREEMEAQWSGPEMQVRFNGGYLLDMLRHLTADPALMRIDDPARPVLLIDSEDAARTYVLMPQRV